MTALLERAVEAMRQMPPDAQDSMAQAILSLAQGVALDAIEPEHLPFALEGLAQIERGKFVSEDEVEEAFGSFER